MAEFSKQYCELYEPEIDWDFDIEEVATEIPNGYYKSIICEGFGFTGIGVGMNGKTYILMQEDGEGFERIEYSIFMNRHRNNLSSHGI